MRTNFLKTIFFCLTPIALIAQQNNADSDYSRPSLSVMLLSRAEYNLPNEISAAFSNINISQKYFENKIATGAVIHTRLKHKKVPLPENQNVSYKNLLSDPAKDSLNAFLVAVQAELEQANYGAKIMEIWSHKKDEQFDVLRQRSLYNATAEDDKTGKNPLQISNIDRLFYQNYLIVLDFDNLTNINEESRGGVQAEVLAIIYRLSIDPALFQSFIKPNFDNPQVLLSHPYKLEYLGHDKLSVSQTYFIPKNQSGWVRPDHRTLYGRLPQDAFEKANAYMEKNISAFKVRASIVQTHPVKAEIGQRENLHLEDRYHVYEYRKKRNGEIVSKRMGTVRALSPIANNSQGLKDAQGKYYATAFKQTHGIRLDEGMYLKQARDLGIGLSGGVNLRANKHTPYLRADFRISRLLNPNERKPKSFGQYLYVELFIESDTVTADHESFVHMGGGFGKRYYATHFLDIEPVVGVYYIGDDNDHKYLYGKAGIRLPLGLTHSLFIVPEANFSFNMSGLLKGETGKEYPLSNNDNLLGNGLTTSVSIRFEF